MDKTFSPIKERILKYIEIKGITKEKFYLSSGLSASNFKGNGAKSELGGDRIVKILSIYEDLNAEWLVTGKGSMLKEQPPASLQTFVPQPKEYQIHEEKSSVAAEPHSNLAKIRELRQTIQQIEVNTGKILQIPIVDVWAAAGHGFYNADHPEV